MIAIHGAREHNLKNLTLTIPRGRFVVVTGVSGSGKSTLAFDLLFAEGQRRFLDAMNTYARQFVEQMARPDVDLITGIPPTVSIEQRNSRGGGKSTVATVTEVYHFLRLLFAKLGVQYCPDCNLPVTAQTVEQLEASLRAEAKRRGKLVLLAPVVKNRKGFHTDVAEWAARHGYAELRADGRMHRTDQPFRLDRFREHDVEIVVGALEAKLARQTKVKPPEQLIAEALDLGRGTLLALDAAGHTSVHSTARACARCGQSYPLLDPKHFSYNSAQGWCPKCRGFGELFYLPDVDRGARADAIEESWFEWQEGKREPCPECAGSRLNRISRAVRLPVLPPKNFWADRETKASPNPTIDDLGRASVDRAWELFRSIHIKGREGEIARDILPEIRERLSFLREVGLGYLELGRSATTLSGGEAQRIRLAAQLGSNLSGVLYVLDEPTIGLHARDNDQLLAALSKLRERGNSLVVVEHDEATMRRADYIIDLGPGAGVHGGQVVAAGSLRELLGQGDSVTGRTLGEQRTFPARGSRRPVERASKTSSPSTRSKKKAVSSDAGASRETADGGETEWLVLHHARAHNLKDLTMRFPLGRLIAVTGVSGSGKSTLIRECLLPALRTHLEAGKRRRSLPRKSGTNQPCFVTGADAIHGVYEVDQNPIGRTPRSIPATYVGFFDDIRQLFSQTPEARLRGYGPGRFSFNSAAGRCPECEGAGMVKLEMNFLPPAYVTCESCQGRRFNRETLDIEHRERNIAQVLDLSVEEALDFFSAHPKILRPLRALSDTGLHYLKLGQTSPTLSGGEAQRLKLVTHLLTGLQPGGEQRLARHRNVFILEEPTIGLHLADVRRLAAVLQRLVEAGHTVIVIEHQLDLIAEGDWVIDLGPDAGEAGGRLVVEGTPEAVARTRGSHTGHYLKALLTPL